MVERGLCYDFVRQSEHRTTCSQIGDIEFKLYVMFVLSWQLFEPLHCKNALDVPAYLHYTTNLQELRLVVKLLCNVAYSYFYIGRYIHQFLVCAQYLPLPVLLCCVSLSDYLRTEVNILKLGVPACIYNRYFFSV